MTDPVRHVCGISGGKDSSALAVFMRDEVPDMEYFFCDTGAELPETYEYLTRLEVVLGRPIERLNADRGFDHWFEMFRGALPSPQMRWCTNYMKIKPLEDWIGDTPTISYVAIRADEANRKGYVSTKPNIETRFPFIDAGIDHAGDGGQARDHAVGPRDDNCLAQLLGRDRRERRHVTARIGTEVLIQGCLLYTSPSPRDRTRSRMPSSA